MALRSRGASFTGTGSPLCLVPRKTVKQNPVVASLMDLLGAPLYEIAALPSFCSVTQARSAWLVMLTPDFLSHPAAWFCSEVFISTATGRGPTNRGLQLQRGLRLRCQPGCEGAGWAVAEGSGARRHALSGPWGPSHQLLASSRRWPAPCRPRSIQLCDTTQIVCAKSWDDRGLCLKWRRKLELTLFSLIFSFSDTRKICYDFSIQLFVSITSNLWQKLQANSSLFLTSELSVI